MALLPSGVNYTSGAQLNTPDYMRTYELMHKWDTKVGPTGISWCEVKLGHGQLITGAIGVHDLDNVYNVPNPETNVSAFQ